VAGERRVGGCRYPNSANRHPASNRYTTTARARPHPALHRTRAGQDRIDHLERHLLGQVFDSSGLIAQELGDSPLETTCSFVDNGLTTLPSLD
jgi:hypothetical protein